MRSCRATCEEVTYPPVDLPSLRFAGADAEERRAALRHRPVRTAVPVGAASKRQPQYMNVMIIFSGGAAFFVFFFPGETAPRARIWDLWDPIEATAS